MYLTIIIYNYVQIIQIMGWKVFRQHAFMALPAHSGLCQTCRSSAVLKAPCSTHIENYFHFLQMKEEKKIEWRFMDHNVIIYENFDLPVKCMYFKTELLTTSNIIPICSQAYKILLIDMSFKGSQRIWFINIPKFELTVCWSASKKYMS